MWKEEAQVLGWQGAFVVLNIVRVLPLHHVLVLCLGGMSTAGIEPASRLSERRYCSKEGRRRPSEKPTEWVSGGLVCCCTLVISLFHDG